MEPMIDAYRKDVHGGNNSVGFAASIGKTGCVLARVPRRGVTSSRYREPWRVRTRAPSAFRPILNYLTGPSEDVAVAAAEALGDHGSEPAIEVLVRALRDAEREDDRARKQDTIQAALERITSESFANSGEWGRWLASES